MIFKFDFVCSFIFDHFVFFNIEQTFVRPNWKRKKELKKPKGKDERIRRIFDPKNEFDPNGGAAATAVVHDTKRKT